MNLRVRSARLSTRDQHAEVAIPRLICKAARPVSLPVEQNAGLEAYTPDLRRQQGIEHTRADTYLPMTLHEQP